MRFLIPCLFTAACLAQSSPFSESYDSQPRRPSVDEAYRQIPRANIIVDADQIQIIVRIEVKAVGRSRAEAGLRDLSAKLSARFEDKEGFELERLEYNFAHPYGKDRASSFLGTKDKESEMSIASGVWALRTITGDDAMVATDSLRALTIGLVSADENKEGLINIIVSEANWRLSNPQDYRNELLHAIRRDAAEATKHLPMGENRLEIVGLDRAVQILPHGSGRFCLFIPYSFIHKSKVTEDDVECGCQGGEGDEEEDEENEQPAETK